MHYPHLHGTAIINHANSLDWFAVVKHTNYQELGHAKMWSPKRDCSKLYHIYSDNGYSLYKLGRFDYLLTYANYEVVIISYTFLCGDISRECFGFTSKHTMDTILSFVNLVLYDDAHYSYTKCYMPKGYEYMQKFFASLFERVQLTHRIETDYYRDTFIWGGYDWVVDKLTGKLFLRG